jgi:hypothetical protein
MVERLTVHSSSASTAADQNADLPISSDVWSLLTRQPITEYRDDAAIKIAGHLFAHGCDYQLVLGMMHAWNSAWCKPPLGYQELTNTIDRIARKEATKILRRLAS